jgi:hypothetical protein
MGHVIVGIRLAIPLFAFREESYMHSYQIIYGFSDIKSAFRTKSRIIKPIDELELWFTFSEYVLFVHDYDDHFKFMPIAVFQEEICTWRYFLTAGSYGERLVRDICETKSAEGALLEIQRHYKLYGYTRVNRI